jgi:hypothetical protein
MMHEREKSDPAIVAMKPANNAERSAAEPVEPRAGAEGKCGPAQHGPGSVPAKRVTGAGAHTASSPSTPEVGAVCGKAARTVLCGGRSEMSVPTAIVACAPRNDGDALAYRVACGRLRHLPQTIPAQAVPALHRHRQPRGFIGAPARPRRAAGEFRSATGTGEAAGHRIF